MLLVAVLFFGVASEVEQKQLKSMAVEASLSELCCKVLSRG